LVISRVDFSIDSVYGISEVGEKYEVFQSTIEIWGNRENDRLEISD